VAREFRLQFKNTLHSLILHISTIISPYVAEGLDKTGNLTATLIQQQIFFTIILSIIEILNENNIGQNFLYL
jgi:phage-related holin